MEGAHVQVGHVGHFLGYVLVLLLQVGSGKNAAVG